MKPEISVIIPLYNRVKLISDTLSSLAVQTYPHWEAIVVDDGSTDGSYELVQELALAEPRIKAYKRNRLPKGASACRNIGLDRAIGKYIVFLDSDDLLSPDCLKERLLTIQRFPSVDFVVFNMLLFREELYDTMIVWNINTAEKDLTRFLRADGVWSITGPIYRREVIHKVKGFDERLPFWQDFEFHIRLLCQGACYVKYLHLPPDCYNRRHSGESISQQKFQSEDKLLTRITVYQNIVRQVEQHQQLTQETSTAIVVFLFNQARKLITDHKNLTIALATWTYASEKGGLTVRLKTVGKLHLNYLYLHQSSGQNISIYSFLAKFASFLLPQKYKRIKSTLCKVTL